jgi:methionyl-tRNA synthetase
MSLVSAHPWLIAVVIWSAIWKMIAMWKSAKNNHMTMFIIIAILNTAGVLEIIYLIWLHFRNKKFKNL